MLKSSYFRISNFHYFYLTNQFSSDSQVQIASKNSKNDKVQRYLLKLLTLIIIYYSYYSPLWK